MQNLREHSTASSLETRRESTLSNFMDRDPPTNVLTNQKSGGTFKVYVVDKYMCGRTKERSPVPSHKDEISRCSCCCTRSHLGHRVFYKNILMIGVFSIYRVLFLPFSPRPLEPSRPAHYLSVPPLMVSTMTSNVVLPGTSCRTVPSPSRSRESPTAA